MCSAGASGGPFLWPEAARNQIKAVGIQNVSSVQVEDSHYPSLDCLYRGTERGKLHHIGTLSHSLKVPLAAYEACNFILGSQARGKESQTMSTLHICLCT